MTCELCKVRGKTWSGSDPKCAFENGKFSKDNWNCATMGLLRDISPVGSGLSGTESTNEKHFKRGIFSWRDDDRKGSIGIIPVPEMEEDELEDIRGYLIMTWYKNRGCTGDALIIDDDSRHELTEIIARKIIEAHVDLLDENPYKNEENNNVCSKCGKDYKKRYVVGALEKVGKWEKYCSDCDTPSQISMR